MVSRFIAWFTLIEDPSGIQAAEFTYIELSIFMQKNVTIVLFLLQELEVEVKKTVDDATKIAKTDSEIGKDELTADICSKFLEAKIRNTVPWNPLQHKRIGPAINDK